MVCNGEGEWYNKNGYYVYNAQLSERGTSLHMNKKTISLMFIKKPLIEMEPINC
jgi:hypothetical protein